jgi:adenylate cyclase
LIGETLSQSERRLAAIMFTDMVGYTALGQKNESLSLALVEEQRKLIRPILARHNGREIKTIGDAFLVEFPNALDAVRCAYDIQRATREFNISIPEERRIHLRVGLHLGDVVESEGDISGDAVNVASRIEPLAEDGGVCLTKQVYDHVQNKFELPLESLGSKSLKNVSAPLEIYRIVMPWGEGKVIQQTQLDKNRIAVLPFANMTPDPQDEYFADGMTEELIDRLSQVRELKVIARTSVMSYKKKEKKVAEIGRELGVGTLVEGSVRKAGNRIRVTVQLISTSTEEHLWSSRYDRDLDDIFVVQTDIAERVVGALKVQLLPSEKKAIEKTPTTSKEAYVLYLKGRYHWNERSLESMKTAIEYFEKAISEDPSFALAYVGLADSHLTLINQGAMKPPEFAQRIKSWVEKALELDSSLAEAHATLGLMLVMRFWDWRRAEFEFKRSIELNPAYPTARQYYGLCLLLSGRSDEGLEQLGKGLELDPFSLIINIDYAWGLVLVGRDAEGIEHAMKTLALDPSFAIGHYVLGLFYSHGAQLEKAVVEFKKALEIIPGFPISLAMLGHAYGTMGRKEDAAKILTELKETSSKEYIPPAYIAMVEFGLGMKEDAFRHLNEAFDERSDMLILLRSLPGFEDMRADERVRGLLTRMGLEV